MTIKVGLATLVYMLLSIPRWKMIPPTWPVVSVLLQRLNIVNLAMLILQQLGLEAVWRRMLWDPEICGLRGSRPSEGTD